MQAMSCLREGKLVESGTGLARRCLRWTKSPRATRRRPIVEVGLAGDMSPGHIRPIFRLRGEEALCE